MQNLISVSRSTGTRVWSLAGQKTQMLADKRFAVKGSISKRFVNTKQLTDLDMFQDGLYQKWAMWPYGMHYWYFNVIDVNKSNVYSYILARNQVGTRLNEQWHWLEEDEYVVMAADFSARRFEITETSVAAGEGSLLADGFELRIKENKVYLMFEENSFVFDTLLADSYQMQAMGAYGLYNLNAKGDGVYLIAQNVMKQGPLGPWNWLHFYFEDGTYVKVFKVAGLNRKLLLGDEVWQLEDIQDLGERVLYRARREGMYFHLEVEKVYTASAEYQPRFSPQWTYNQVGVVLRSVKTNVAEFNSLQKGMGIMELATGLSL